MNQQQCNHNLALEFTRIYAHCAYKRTCTVVGRKCTIIALTTHSCRPTTVRVNLLGSLSVLQYILYLFFSCRFAGNF